MAAFHPAVHNQQFAMTQSLPHPPPPTLLGEINRAAKASFCPAAHTPALPSHSHGGSQSLLALGTMASTIDDSFETKCSLEIYDVSPSSLSLSPSPALLGSLTTRDTFHSVAWGGKGVSDGSLAYGVIAGGMSDGAVNLWNAGAIIASPSKSPSQPLLVRADGHHRGAVSALQFHPTQPNLLASGAADGQILIWDLADPHNPKSSKPNPSLTGVEHPITCLGWNKKVGHIIATSNDVGETTVWDLRQKKSIVKFRPSARTQVRSTGLVWNPEASVQLALTYANYPVCEIWDLRQSMTPKLKLENFHSGSIFGIDWNPHDSHLLMTAGEDQRIGVWDPIQGHLLCEYSSGTYIASNIYDVTWDPHEKGVFVSCSYDQQSRVSVQSLPASGDHVPSWLRKPAGASLAFGGKFARVTELSQSQPPTPTAAAAGTVAPTVSTSISVSTLSLEPQLLTLAQQFLDVFQRGDFVNFCDHKLATATNADDRIVWTFMKILYEDQASQRLSLLKELGFQQPESKSNASKPKANDNGHHSVSQSQTAVASVNEISEDQFFDTFNDNLSLNSSQDGAHSQTNGIDEAKHTDTVIADGTSANTIVKSNNDTACGKPVKKRPINDELAYTSFTTSDDDESMIRHALLYGDFQSAVEQCLATGRLADAIVFSSFGPPSLWEETRAAYFANHPHPFIRQSMRQVSSGQFVELVTQSSIEGDNWKQVLAVIITYTNSDKYRTLVNMLGERLESHHHYLAALVCYMCCSNVDRAVELFSRPSLSASNTHTPAHSDPVLSFHHAMEKIAVFAHATQAHTLQPPSQSLSLKYSEYATMLANQGVFIAAWNYLRLSNPYGNDSGSASLLDRLYLASYTTPEPIQQQPPGFPYQLVQVNPDPALITVDAQYENSKRVRQQLVQHTLVHHQQPTAATNTAVPPQQQAQATAQPPYGQPPQQPVYGAPQTPQRPVQQPPLTMPGRPSVTQPPMPSTHAHQSHGQFYQPGQQAQLAPQPLYSQQPSTQPHFPPQQHQQQPMPSMPQSSQPPMPYGRDPRAMQPAANYPPHPTPQQPQPSMPGHGYHPQPPMPQTSQQQPMPAPRDPYGQPVPQPQHQQPAYGQQPPMPQPGGPYQHPQPSRVPPQYGAPAPPQPQPHQQPMGYGHPQANPTPQQQPPMPSPQHRPQQPGMPPMQQPGMPPMQQPDPRASQQPQQPMPFSSHHSTTPVTAPPAQTQQPQLTQPRIFNPAAAVSQTPGPAPVAHPPPSAHPVPSTPGPAPASHAQPAPQSQSFDPSSYPIAPEHQALQSMLESVINQLRQRVQGMELKKLNDQHSRLSALYVKLSPSSAATLSQSLTASLQGLSQCLSVGDYTTSIKTHLNSIVRNDWTGNNDWIMPLKTICEMARKYLGGQ